MSAEHEDDRPFVCTAPGCAMRFTNEDHLTVHKQKHEMSLALDVGASRGLVGFTVADQTPTPTKFLKNCDEIGLFQDLNKNPFDDAFKRATEAMNGGNDAGMPGPTSLDTPVLPSPFVTRLRSPVRERSPLSIGPKSKEKSKLAEVKPNEVDSVQVSVTESSAPLVVPPSLNIPAIKVSSPDVLSEQMTSPDSGVTSSGEQVVTLTSDDVSEGGMVRLVVDGLETDVDLGGYYLMVDGRLVPLNGAVPVSDEPSGVALSDLALSAVTSSGVTSSGVDETTLVTAAPTARSGVSNTKQRLKEVLTGSAAAKGLISPPTVNPGTVQQQQQQQQQLGVLASVDSLPEFYIDDTKRESDPSPSKRPRRGVEEDQDVRRAKFLERNRAAAARCRNKKKMRMDDLELRCGDLVDHNQRLQTEVNTLKDEVASLKLMLLAHQDCPVTQQQQRDGVFNIRQMISDHPGLATVPQPAAADTTRDGRPAAGPGTVTVSIPVSQAGGRVTEILQRFQPKLEPAGNRANSVQNSPPIPRAKTLPSGYTLSIPVSSPQMTAVLNRLQSQIASSDRTLSPLQLKNTVGGESITDVQPKILATNVSPEILKISQQPRTYIIPSGSQPLSSMLVNPNSGAVKRSPDVLIAPHSAQTTAKVAIPKKPMPIAPLLIHRRS